MSKRLFAFWVVAAFIGGFSVGYFVMRWHTGTFLDSTMANLISTLIGILVGVPVAVQLSRTQQVAQEKSVRERKALDLDGNSKLRWRS